jgi:universal stress protein A
MNIKPAKQPGHVLVDLSSNDSEQLSKAAEDSVMSRSSFALHTILVPTDLSDCSRKAIQYAVPFAKCFKARIILLHILPDYYSNGWEPGTIDYKSAIEENSKICVLDQLEMISAGNIPGEIHVDIKVRRGAPAREIVAAAREMNVDLILMSTHGHRGRIHAFIGSVASDVTRLAPCPVLVVRQREHEFVPPDPVQIKPRAGRTDNNNKRAKVGT